MSRHAHPLSLPVRAERGAVAFLAWGLPALVLVLCAVLLTLWGTAGPGAASVEAGRVEVAESAPAREVPRCAFDDFNDGSQALCYTVRTTDGARLLITRDDVVTAVICPSGERVAEGDTCRIPTLA